jgi:hypothetical protein
LIEISKISKQLKTRQLEEKLWEIRFSKNMLNF